ncbi:MAG: hypothetical protein ACM33V_03060 [Chloroflexota bacterium]|nr:hypothetical protein [Anaerolineales bacterium]
MIFDLNRKTSAILHSYTPTAGTSGWLDTPRWSPDSQRLAYARQPSHSDLIRTVDLSVIDVPSWNIWQNCLPGDEGIPLARLAKTP